MKLSLSPVRRDETLSLERDGDTLVINGARLDLSRMTEGATLPAAAVDTPWLTGTIARIDGVLHLTVILPCGANAPHETRFPAPVKVDVDGPITLPVHDIPPEPDAIEEIAE